MILLWCVCSSFETHLTADQMLVIIKTSERTTKYIQPKHHKTKWTRETSSIY